MKSLNKKYIVWSCILVTMFSMGMLSQYLIQNVKASKELEKLKFEVELSQENNQQLEREIGKLHQEIKQYQQKESTPAKEDHSS